MLIVKRISFSLENQSGHVICRSCLHLNLLGTATADKFCVWTCAVMCVSFMLNQKRSAKLNKIKISYPRIIATCTSSYILWIRSDYLYLIGEKRKVEEFRSLKCFSLKAVLFLATPGLPFSTLLLLEMDVCSSPFSFSLSSCHLFHLLQLHYFQCRHMQYANASCRCCPVGGRKHSLYWLITWFSLYVVPFF